MNNIDLSKDLKAKLAHIIWIGGGTDAGKTSTSRSLAAKYGLEIYHFDRPSPSWQAVEMNEEEHPNCFKWEKMSDDERWLRPAEEQADPVYGMWAEKHSYRLQDLLSMPKDKKIVGGVWLSAELYCAPDPECTAGDLAGSV